MFVLEETVLIWISMRIEKYIKRDNLWYTFHFDMYSA